MGRSTPSPSTAPEIQTRLGVAGAAPRKSIRQPLGCWAAGLGWQVLPAHHSPASFPLPRLAQGQRPRAFSVCAPQASGKEGPAHTGASSRLCRPSWAGNTPIGLGCQLPVPGLGNELLAAPHDSSPGCLGPQASRPPPCSAPAAARKHM